MFAYRLKFFLVFGWLILGFLFITIAQTNDSLNYVFLNHVFENNIEAASADLSNGADVNFVTHDSVSALHYSVSNMSLQMTQLLIGAGADPDKPDTRGYTPMMLAAVSGNDTLMFELIMAGADVNSRNKAFETPLHFAVLSGNPVAVDMLLFYSANPDLADADSIVPLHLAAYNGLDVMIDLLLQYGANPDKRDLRNNNPCFYALLGGSLPALLMLSTAGCDIHLRNSEGINMIEMAFMKAQSDILAFLVEMHQNDSLLQNETGSDLLEKEDAKKLWRTALKEDLPEMKELLRKYSIQRPYALFFGPVYTGISVRGFSDFFMYTGLQAAEVNYGFYLGASYGSRLWRNSVIFEKSPALSYQLKEYRSFIQAEFLKYNTLFRTGMDKGKVNITLGFRPTFTLANYRAMKMKEKIRITYAYTIGLEYVKRWYKVSLDYQLWDYDSKNFSRHQINTGIAARF